MKTDYVGERYIVIDKGPYKGKIVQVTAVDKEHYYVKSDEKGLKTILIENARMLSEGYKPEKRVYLEYIPETPKIIVPDIHTGGKPLETMKQTEERIATERFVGPIKETTSYFKTAFKESAADMGKVMKEILTLGKSKPTGGIVRSPHVAGEPGPESFPTADPLGIGKELSEGLLWYPGNEIKNLEELKKAAELIQALRKRSAKKSISNIRLSKENDRYIATMKEIDRDMEATIGDNRELKKMVSCLEEKSSLLQSDYDWMKKDRNTWKERADHYEKLNEHHQSEVEKGNEYREKLKETVESLHEQLRGKTAAHETEIRAHLETKTQLERMNKIVDALIK